MYSTMYYDVYPRLRGGILSLDMYNISYIATCGLRHDQLSENQGSKHNKHWQDCRVLVVAHRRGKCAKQCVVGECSVGELKKLCGRWMTHWIPELRTAGSSRH